jgi:hypothetical protein
MTPSIIMTRKPSNWLAKTKTTRLLSGSFCFVIVTHNETLLELWILRRW